MNYTASCISLSGLDEQYFQQYLELIHLMKVPVIREVIFGKLVEMKAMAKDEIEEFEKTVGSRK